MVTPVPPPVARSVLILGLWRHSSHNPKINTCFE